MKYIAVLITFSTIGTLGVLMEGQKPGRFDMSSSIRAEACSPGQSKWTCGSGVRGTHGGSTVFIQSH